MTEQDQTEITPEEEPEVEGFGSILTTRSNIKATRPAAAPAVGGIGGGQTEIGIKENGVK